jgi:hypothetical protein
VGISEGHDEIDLVLDLMKRPLMSWQRRVIRQVIGATTPDELFCHQTPKDQIRMGCDYPALMEHFAVEVIRRSRD